MTKNKENRNLKQDLAIAELKNDISHIKEDVKYIRSRQDWIIAVVIIGTMLSILASFWSRIIM